MKQSLDTIPTREYMPGYRGKMIHTQNMTLAFWQVDEGAAVPEHSHHNEQVMHVLEGQFELTVDGKTGVYGPGDLVIIAPDQVHGGKALTACRLLDVFSPVREAYR